VVISSVRFLQVAHQHPNFSWIIPAEFFAVLPISAFYHPRLCAFSNHVARFATLLKAVSSRLAAAHTLSFTALQMFESPSRQGPPLAYAKRQTPLYSGPTGCV
jgi:hypothetical protein